MQWKLSEKHWEKAEFGKYVVQVGDLLGIQAGVIPDQTLEIYLQNHDCT